MTEELTTQSQVSTTTSPKGLPSRLLNLMNNNNIDWDGVCEFDDNGKVTGFKTQSTSNSYSMKPIPQTDELIRDTQEAKKLLDSIAKPATTQQIGIAIKKLSLHCGMQAKAPEDVKFMLMDYCQDLKGYPVSLINEACEKYRKLPEGNDFLPSSGKLITLINAKYLKQQKMRKRINQILGIPTKPKEESILDQLNALL